MLGMSSSAARCFVGSGGGIAGGCHVPWETGCSEAAGGVTAVAALSAGKVASGAGAASSTTADGGGVGSVAGAALRAAGATLDAGLETVPEGSAAAA